MEVDAAEYHKKGDEQADEQHLQIAGQDQTLVVCHGDADSQPVGLALAQAADLHIDEIKGVYVPFWLFDSDADAQLPFTASYITPYPELNVEEADLFYQEGTPEVPFQTNQEWYATFTGEDGSRYAVTLEDEDTLALKFYLEGEMSYLSLVNTVYFARQEAMG